MINHDVVIIGGSLAGASCARELERLGIDAIALERDHFPRDKVCGGFISPGAVDCVERLGLLSEVRSGGAVDVTAARVHIDGRQIEIPFNRSGLGISRNTLDAIVARSARIVQGYPVREVRRCHAHFLVDGISCSVVIDAAGKLSRFTKRQSVDEFGIQYFEPGSRRSVLDFWFFEDGYGGGVSVDGGRSNVCFLVKKSALPRYVNHEGCLVTGPLAYDSLPGDFIAIGDAAGMVDPFCGEGMRHALESGILAAHIVARGIRLGTSYDEMKLEYESRWGRRWSTRRAAGALIRRWRKLIGTGLSIVPTRLLNRVWD